MKNNYMITKEATKYWKKAIKKDRVMVTCKNNTVYIVNGYNAFKMPAISYIWDDLARPAFMVDMPAEGAAFQYFRGEKQPAISSEIVNILDRNLSEKTEAKRSPFQFDGKDITLRLYKNSFGSVASINASYDSMVDHSQVKSVYCGGKHCPVILNNEHFTALIMPVRTGDEIQNQARDIFKKMLEV